MENNRNEIITSATKELFSAVRTALRSFFLKVDTQQLEKSERCDLYGKLYQVVQQEMGEDWQHGVVEVRPKELECDVVRYQNNKEKWVALVGLLDGRPYEIFTGLQDDEEGLMLPKSCTHGKIVKQVNEDGTKRYDFQFVNKRGYKMTVEGLSEKFNPEYWNYAKLISGVLRYRMPIEHVIKLVSQLQLTSDNINTWKVGVERALKKYVPGNAGTEKEETAGHEK